MEAQNDARLRVWKAQPSRFRAQAVIDIPTWYHRSHVPGKKKEGADFAYEIMHLWVWSRWSSAWRIRNEVLYTVNRAANRPSHDGAIPWIERAVELVTAGGFRQHSSSGATPTFRLTSSLRLDVGRRGCAVSSSAWTPIARS